MMWCSLLSALYFALLILLPAHETTAQAYNLSNLQYKGIRLTIALPTVVIWFIAFLGYGSLRHYAGLVRKATEGRYFKQLADGCAWLAWSLPVTMLATYLLKSAASQWPHFHASAIIVTNYLSLLLSLAAFVLIGNAARRLLQGTPYKFSLSYIRFFVIFFALAGILYCYLVFRHLDVPGLNSSGNPYFLPVWLLVLTVIMPQLYAWFIGLLGAYELALFGKHTDGLLYRQALLYVSWGIIAVIASLIALQYINMVAPQTGYLQINAQLVANVVFCFLEAAGFGLLAAGATKLTKIEQV